MRKFALVGCGHIAKIHAENIGMVGELVAVCDTNKENADAFAAQYKANPYSSIDELLATEKELYLVCICTPNGMHAEHVIKSLQARKHVLCESPLCLTIAAAWQITETEKFCRRQLFVVNPVRYSPALQDLKQKLTAGEFGKVLGFDFNCILKFSKEELSGWKGTLFPGGGLLYSAFHWAADTIQRLFEIIAEVKDITIQRSRLVKFEAEETGTAVLQTKSGVAGSFRWSAIENNTEQQTTLKLFTEKGTITLTGEYFQTKESADSFNIHKPYAEDDYLRKLYTSVYKHLMQSLIEKDNSFPGAVDALGTVEIIETIYKAAPQT